MPKIQVAYVHDAKYVGFNFYQSMMSLDNTDLMPNHISSKSNTMGLVDARNHLVEYFLDKTDATHLWWIDSDMGFAPDTPQRLLKHELDAVGARTYGLGPVAPDGLGGFVTKSYLVAYDLVQQADGFLHYTPIDDIDKDELKEDQLSEQDKDTLELPDSNPKPIYLDLGLKTQTNQDDNNTNQQKTGVQQYVPRSHNSLDHAVSSPQPLLISPYPPSRENDKSGPRKLHKVAATGTGCILVSRRALELVRKDYGDCWFDQVSYPQRGEDKPMRISEDLSFCYRLGTVGIPIYIDLSVKTNHMKTVWVSER
jgi:hypothetical protein